MYFVNKEPSAAWKSMIDQLSEFEIRCRDEGDPIVFHGTSPQRAESILKDGIASSVRVIGTEEESIAYLKGLYFGTISSADFMATRTDQPAIIAARISTLMAHGELRSDSNVIPCGACRRGRIWQDREDPKVPDMDEGEGFELSWEESLRLFGTLACIANGDLEQNLVLLDPAGDVEAALALLSGDVTPDFSG